MIPHVMDRDLVPCMQRSAENSISIRSLKTDFWDAEIAAHLSLSV